MWVSADGAKLKSPVPLERGISVSGHGVKRPSGRMNASSRLFGPWLRHEPCSNFHASTLVLRFRIFPKDFCHVVHSVWVSVASPAANARGANHRAISSPVHGTP